MTMSQRAVEQLLGRLITDEDFRSSFFAAPRRVCRDHHIEVSDDELTALIEMDHLSLGAFAGCLDAKIVRASGASLEPEESHHRGRR